MKTFRHSEETMGEFFVLAHILFAAFFPIFAHAAGRSMPPLLFAGISNIVAGVGAFLYAAMKQQVARVFDREYFR